MFVLWVCGGKVGCGRVSMGVLHVGLVQYHTSVPALICTDISPHLSSVVFPSLSCFFVAGLQQAACGALPASQQQ